MSVFFIEKLDFFCMAYVGQLGDGRYWYFAMMHSCNVNYKNKNPFLLFFFNWVSVN